MGVVIDGGFGLDAEAVHDDFGAAPLQEGFLDLLAESVAADLAAEAVIFEVNSFLFARGGWRSGKGGSLRAGEIAHVASFGGFNSAPTDANTKGDAAIFVEIRRSASA